MALKEPLIIPAIELAKYFQPRKYVHIELSMFQMGCREGEKLVAEDFDPEKVIIQQSDGFKIWWALAPKADWLDFCEANRLCPECGLGLVEHEENGKIYEHCSNHCIDPVFIRKAEVMLDGCSSWGAGGHYGEV